MDGLFNYFMLRDLGYFILDLLGILAIPLVIAAIYRLIRRDNTERIKAMYQERIDALKDQIKELKERMAFKEQQHKEELRDLLRSSKMVAGLKNALDTGLIKIRCSEHDSDVEVLADGTIICREKHRIWPPEKVEDEEYEEISG
ncbi:hypothetical protein JdFRA1000001_17c [uncultured archaeal virus]|uniref:Uncharacterized protein n=1 Tax=uncultured archaeal virus TaxID=1960247 RepID=A0A1S5Y304_9VIRU|nr:hypothetical protein JdFRA1000001_17c [uncultured archaeal virus]